MNLETRTLTGRPRNGWQDEVREVGRTVGGEGWHVKVHNREERKKLLRTARYHCILHMPMVWMNGSKNRPQALAHWDHANPASQTQKTKAILSVQFQIVTASDKESFIAKNNSTAVVTVEDKQWNMSGIKLSMFTSWRHIGKWRLAPCIHNLDTRQGLVVTYIPWLLLHQGKSNH